MSSDVMPKAELLNVVNDWVAAETSGAQVILWTNDISPNTSTAYAALTEPIASWYSRQNATYFPVSQNPDGSMQVEVQSLNWAYSGVDDSETIFGYSVVSASPYRLLHSKRLDAPVVMAVVPDGFVSEPTLQFAPISGFGPAEE